MKKLSKQLLCFMLAMCMIVFAVGCAKSGTDTTPTAAPTQSGGTSGGTNTAPTAAPDVKSSKDTLIVANTSGEPGNLHPYNTVSIGVSLVNRAILEPLVLIDDQGNIAPSLAESWEASDTEIVFHLRKGVKFHNGEEFKASDVVFSLKEVILNSTGGYAGQFETVDVEKLEAVDDYTVKVPLKEPDSTLMSYFASNLLIVSEKAYTEMGEQFQFQPVGTGPFKFKSWDVGDNITVERFDDYWGGPAKLKTVIFRTISEVSQAMIEVETGGVDIMINPLGSDIQRVLNGEVKGVQAITQATCILRNNNLNFNWLSETMKNHKVREAIAHCIDREAWTKVISPGNGVPAYSCVAAGIWGYDKELETNYPYPYDIEKAKALMAEAGYPNGFTAVLLTDARPYHLATVELVQAALAQIGITVEVQTMELAQQKEIMVTGEGFDMYMLDNVGNASNPLASLWRDSHPRFAQKNSSHYHFYTVNDEQGQKYADLLDQIRATTDDAKRLELTKEMQKVFTEDIVWLPINSIQGYFLGTDKLQNVGFTSDMMLITNQTYFS